MKTEIKQRIEKIKAGQVPEGYKKTKIGIVPKEWEIHKLSEHLTESRILGSNGAAAKKITVKLWNKGVFEKQELHEGSANTTYYKRKSGQFVYSKLDFLNCAFGIIPEHLDGYESTQDLPCFDVDGVDTYYLLTYVTQRNFYTHFGMIADGGRKARRVGTKDMMSFPLAYPPLAEQKKIAKILSAQDKLIELQQKKIEELQKLKKVYLNKMFPKKGENVPEWRFKGFTDAWEQRKLGDVAKYRNGKAHENDISEQGKFIVVNSKFVSTNGEVRKFSNKQIEPLFKNEIAFVLSDVPNGRAIARTFLVDKNDKYTLNQRIAGITPIEGTCPYFLHILMNRNKYFLQFDDGAKQTNLSVDDVIEFAEYYPSSEEQQQVGVLFQQLDHLITLHQRKLEEMKKQKKSLMQLLLTGIVRA